VLKERALTDWSTNDGLGNPGAEAGAKAVNASLWKVADEGTAKLMVDIYRRRERGAQSKIGAVREAQVALMEREVALGGAVASPAFELASHRMEKHGFPSASRGSAEVFQVPETG
jgi:CHAT domain-containing protein